VGGGPRGGGFPAKISPPGPPAHPKKGKKKQNNTQGGRKKKKQGGGGWEKQVLVVGPRRGLWAPTEHFWLATGSARRSTLAEKTGARGLLCFTGASPHGGAGLLEGAGGVPGGGEIREKGRGPGGGGVEVGAVWCGGGWDRRVGFRIFSGFGTPNRRGMGGIWWGGWRGPGPNLTRLSHSGPAGTGDNGWGRRG